MHWVFREILQVALTLYVQNKIKTVPLYVEHKQIKRTTLIVYGALTSSFYILVLCSTIIHNESTWSVHSNSCILCLNTVPCGHCGHINDHFLRYFMDQMPTRFKESEMEPSSWMRIAAAFMQRPWRPLAAAAAAFSKSPKEGSSSSLKATPRDLAAAAARVWGNPKK